MKRDRVLCTRFYGGDCVPVGTIFEMSVPDHPDPAVVTPGTVLVFHLHERTLSIEMISPSMEGTWFTVYSADESEWTFCGKVKEEA